MGSKFSGTLDGKFNKDFVLFGENFHFSRHSSYILFYKFLFTVKRFFVKLYINDVLNVLLTR